MRSFEFPEISLKIFGSGDESADFQAKIKDFDLKKKGICSLFVTSFLFNKAEGLLFDHATVWS